MKQFGVILILAIVCGALAGVIATVLTNQSLDRYAQSLADSERLFTISQEKPRPLPGTYEEALSRIQEVGWPAVATMRPISADSLRVSDWVTADSASGVGTVITSDGWLLFHRDAVASFTDVTTGAEVWIQGERFTIEQSVEDTQSELILVKVDAQGLPTLAFGPAEDMLGGDLLFALTGMAEILPTSLKDAGEPVGGLVLPAEAYVTQWEATENIPTPGPILNAAGELVGFANEDAMVLPLHHFRPFIQSTLRNGSVKYAGLGAYTVSISDVLNLDESITGRSTFGALVVSPDSRTSAVLAGSPAAEAGIQEGDIIISIDDVLITENESLAELLASYEPEQSSVIAVLRGDEQIEFSVTFTDLQTLSY